jgi:hypothetical protein
VGRLQSACDQLLEASIPLALKDASTALSGDWTDVESWSLPPPRQRNGQELWTACPD